MVVDDCGFIVFLLVCAAVMAAVFVWGMMDEEPSIPGDDDLDP